MSNEEPQLTVRPRPSTAVTLHIPLDTWATLQKVAQRRDTGLQALLKLYIGQGLRQDTARLWSERVLATTAEVLTRHGQSEEEVAAILHETRAEAV